MSTGADSPVDRLVTLPTGLPELTLGWEVVRWASKYLKQPNGPKAGQRFEFVDSQIRFLLWWYAVDEQGDWLFHRSVRRLAKGSGKSPFAALISLAELTANVRLKDFDPRVPGGCVGKPVDMPLVQVVATAESQTANTMRMIRAFAPKKSRLVAEFLLDPGKTQYFKAPEGTLEQITSSYTAAEGAEATHITADETEHWRPSNGGPELASTLADNLAKSGSRMMATCNAWVPGRESVAEADWAAWVAQEEGRTRGRSRILYDARVAPPETSLTDEESLRRGLEFVYDDCWWANRRAITERIWDPASKPDDSKRKYLNWPTADLDSWTTQQKWALLADPSKVVADGDEVVLFFDGSKSRDATALIACRVSDGHVFTVDVWEPDPAHNTLSVVSVGAVEQAVEYAFERWNPVGFFGDVREWESFVKVSWPERYADRLVIHAVPSGRDPQPIAWDMRSHVFDFTKAAELVLEEINESAKVQDPSRRLFTHDGDSRLARHVANARRRPNRWGVSIGKESEDSPNKIDAAVCMIGARMVRRLLLASPEWAQRNTKKQRTGRVHGFA